MPSQGLYSILIVDDEPLIRKSLNEILKIAGFDTSTAINAEEAVALFSTKSFDIVITDMKLPKMSGLELLNFIKKTSPATEVILITGYGSIETAVDAMKKGAFDYVTKPIVDDEIKILIEKIIEKKCLLEENRNLRQLVSKNKRTSFCGMIGSSLTMQAVYNLVESVADTNATIMINGESGTGKGIVAKAIHQCDPKRRNMPFVEVSCGALSETLLESELFGHVKGAFTGAFKDKKGRFEIANNGTIFLDEINTCSPNLQVKLLRILQDGGFERVGDTQSLKTNARVIVATNQDLEKLVEEGSFREDLYYRVHVIPLIMPPLRERREDIHLLVKHFIAVSNKKNNKNIIDVDENVKKLFMDHPWPGNIRQLENIIEGAVIMSRKALIAKEYLPKNFEKTRTNPERKSLQEELKGPAKEIILNALNECQGNRSKAAVKLGINRTTLYNNMKKYDIPFGNNMAIDKIKTSLKLEQILLNFIDVLRINILVVDSKGNPVLAPKTGGYGFHGATQWGILQYLGTPELLSKFQKEGYYLKSIDQFGFQNFAVPVQGFDTAAFLIVGPVILNKKFEQSRYQTIAQELGLNLTDFLESLNEIRVLSFNSLKSILDLLFELSQYASKMDRTEIPEPAPEVNQTSLSISVLKTLLELSMALTQAECGSIMLLDKLTNELSIQVFKGINLEKLQNVPIKLGEGIAGLAAQKKKSFVINEGHSSNRIRHLLKKPELKCAVVLPIINNNKEVLGVMNISTHQATGLLATHSRQMLKSLNEITSGTFSHFL